MTAYLLVRAVVPEAERTAFDCWYETEHLPDVKTALQPHIAFRGWCDEAPGIHMAVYQFASAEQARAALASRATDDLIAEFDRVWQGRVHRTREVYDITQAIGDSLMMTKAK